MKVRRIDFSPAEFLAGVAGMSFLDIGVYWVLCSLMYESEGVISRNDTRLEAFKGHGNATNAAIARLIAAGKIEAGNGSEITQKRVRNELETARKRIENGSEMARKRWRFGHRINGKQSLKNDLALPQAVQTINHQPSTTTMHALSGETEKPETQPLDRKQAETIYRVTGIWKDEWGARPENTLPNV
jgi:uncharacterized protein YdaU (DUF1376 family)